MDINRRNKLSNLKKRNLVSFSSPDSMIAEEYRTIRTNIQFLTANRGKRIFLITSPGVGEGKTTTATNLAVSMAQQKESVLLVDANIRNPAVHYVFNIPNTTGLTDVLIGKVSFEEAVYQTRIGRLEILTGGSIPFNPAELIGSQMMKDLLKKVILSYDTVLIDSAPILGVTDTALLANLCDGVVMVITQGKTKLDNVVESKRLLEFSNTELLGVILNEK